MPNSNVIVNSFDYHVRPSLFYCVVSDERPMTSIYTAIFITNNQLKSPYHNQTQRNIIFLKLLCSVSVHVKSVL